MKQTLFFLLLFTQLGFAQQKGQWQIGAYATGRWSTPKAGTNLETQDKAIVLYPNVSLWLSKNAQLGVALPIGNEKQDNTYPEEFFSIDKEQAFRIGIAPYFRQYIMNKKIRPFAHLSFSYNSWKYKWHKIQGETGTLKADKEFGVQLGAGAVYNLNERIGIECMALYNPFKISYYDKKYYVSFGVQYNLKK